MGVFNHEHHYVYRETSINLGPLETCDGRGLSIGHLSQIDNVGPRVSSLVPLSADRGACGYGNDVCSRGCTIDIANLVNRGSRAILAFDELFYESLQYHWK